MGKQILINELGIYLPDKLKLDLDILLDDVINSQMDLVIVIDGKEGSGKSYDARLIGKYCSFITKTSFNVNNIHFNTKDYIKFSESSPKYTINILDESRESLNRKRGMSKSNVLFTNWLSENRDKQQIHILLLPAIHDLDNYISIWRMKLLIHKLLGHSYDINSFSGYKLVRGIFRVYENNKNLHQVLFNRQKYGYYAYPKIPKYERKIKYTEVFTESEIKQYESKKKIKRNKKYNEDKTKQIDKYKKLIYDMNVKGGMTQEQIARIVGKSRTIVGDIIRGVRFNADAKNNI